MAAFAATASPSSVVGNFFFYFYFIFIYLYATLTTNSVYVPTTEHKIFATNTGDQRRYTPKSKALTRRLPLWLAPGSNNCNDDTLITG